MTLGDRMTASVALQLAESLDLAVFPLRPGTKIPTTLHGFKYATTSH